MFIATANDASYDIDVFTNTLWNALNADNKISLWVRFTDLATGKTENAYQIGSIIGQELRAAGFNLNLAPVLDVCTKPDSANGNRIFSAQPEEVAAFGRAYIQGLAHEGILATGKHFPGHGDTNVDSHFSLPVVQKDRETIEQTELVSFKAAIDSGIHAIMSAHVVYPSLDPACVPATVSRPILTGLLREQLGFKGLLLSDGMEMKAVMDLYGIEDAVWRALCAGDFARLDGLAFNDLASPAIALNPAVGAAIDDMLSCGARFARMSGSGSCCFGVFDEPAKALEALKPRWPRVWSVETRPCGVEFLE